MKLTAGLLTLLCLPTLAVADGTMATLTPPERAQDWFGAPVIPEIFRSAGPFDSPPPLGELFPQETPAPSTADVPTSEKSWGQGLTALDLRAWQKEDDLQFIREWAGDALFGLPLLFPQLIVEAVLPRGLKVGPTTVLYRTDQGDSSLVVVVLDQMLFHEAEFFARVQEIADDRREPDDFARGQKGLLRRSVMRGLRASFAVPGLTVGLVLQTASEEGAAGLLLVPPLGAALLYLKGVDHKFRIEDDFQFRFKIASGREWVEGSRSGDGVPTLSVDIRIFDLPVGILGSFELSRRGMAPEFIGIGTSLSAVEELIGREERRDQPID